MYRGFKAFPRHSEGFERGLAHTCKMEPGDSLVLRTFITSEPAPGMWRPILGVGSHADPFPRILKPSESEYHIKLGKYLGG